MSLSSGFHYETTAQRICGYEDLGTLGRTRNYANHALTFMVRGIKKNYKIPVAIYFTKDTIKTNMLKQLIVVVIEVLQGIGFHVMATVCDQGPTNRAAINLLTREYATENMSPYSFTVNNQEICTIFDVPHLLKNTRNALLQCHIEYESKKFAKFVHIQEAFNLDQQKRTYKMMNKLKPGYFNFGDTFLKIKVKVAAQQMSQTVAAAIETFSTTGDLPVESLHTAEFVHTIDNLFDSLNGSHLNSPDGKILKCALSEESPHLKFWSDLLPKIRDWKIIDCETGQLRNNYKFHEGWQTTVKAIMRLWANLKDKGLQYLLLRNLNQDPLENLFGQIRQHGICNTNPTPHQFIAALKTVVVNNFAVPLSKSGNCEEDYCSSLGDFGAFLQKYTSAELDLDATENINNLNEDLQFDSDFNEENQATSYVAGYILKKISISECETCHSNLFSKATEKTFIHHFQRVR
ncbi:hypothetical protein NQ315_005699 [Exocentrus adspersus]|uniref:Transposase n=1 Tax=Exocentrus adspersus TaxID=1586481 RepID=A0AAV8VII9_9CUCU|nr:hypothetical protein NQ315_005699 [Exocentrus adspersus]